MKPRNKTIQHLSLIALTVTGFSAPAVHAANDVWIGNTDANFGTLSNWTGSVTPNGNTPVFGIAGTAGAVLNNDLSGASYAGLTFNSGASAYTIGGNSFTLTGNITNNSSSLQTINNAMGFTTRTFSGGTGGLALGGTLTSSNSIIVNSGAVAINGAATIDGGAGSNVGFLTVSGNTSVTISSGGSLTILGSTNATKPNSIIGQNVTGTSTLLVNGGTLTVGGNQGFVLGNSVTLTDRTGVLTVSSGTATITAGSATLQNQLNFISLGRDGANGIINLDGGTLETGRQFVRDGSGGGTVGAGTANFNFNGGVLKALAGQTSGNGWFETATTGNFQVVTTTVKSGGAKIDTNGFNTNISTVLAHDSGLGGTADGGLTKSGSGTLTLNATNTYTGKTTVSGGSLALASTGSIANSSEISINGGNFNVSAATGFSLGAGQSLTGSGGSVTGDITVNGTLAIGNSPGTMTFDNDLTIGGAAVSNFEFADIAFGTGTYDLAQGGAGLQTVTFGGTLNLFFSGGTYVSNTSAQIFDFESYSGNFTAVNFSGLGAGQSAVFDSSTGFVTVVPEPGAVLLGGIGLLALLRRRRNS